MRIIPRLYMAGILCFAIIFCSCDKTASPRTTDPLYVGYWSLIANDGSNGHRDYVADDGFSLLITKDSIITMAHHERVSATTYQVTRDTSFYFGAPRMMDELIRGDGASFFFTATDDTFVQYVGIPAADGGSATYTRLRAID